MDAGAGARGATRSVWLREHTREAIAAVLPEATLVVPVGATEQHGPHLPVGVDAMIAEWVAAQAAQRAQRASHAPFLVAPAVAVGCSAHHLPYAGTLSLRSSTLLQVLADLVDSAVAGGFRRVFLLNGHGGNQDVVHQAARDAAVQHPLVAGAASYWTLAWDRLVRDPLTARAGALPGHAGGFETSLVMARWPQLVDAQRLPAAPHEHQRFDPQHPLTRAVVERHGWVQDMDGFSDDARHASAEIGEVLCEHVVAATADVLARFAAEPLPGAPPARGEPVLTARPPEPRM